MSDLGDASRQLMGAFRANVTGLQQAPDYPPENASDFPFLVLFPGTGTNEWRHLGHRIDNHALRIELHISRKDLPYDIEEAVSFAESIPSAVKTAEAAGDLSAISNVEDMSYTFGAMQWGTTDTVGYIWTLNIRIDQIE